MKLTKWTGCFAPALLSAAVALACGGCWLVFGPQQHPNLERLLDGDEQIGVASVVFITYERGQQRRTELTHPDSLQYLSAALRQATREGYVPHGHGKSKRVGISYEARIRLSPAGAVLVGLVVPNDADGLTLGYPLDGVDDPTYWWVQLPQPMPAPLAEVVGRLRKP